MLRRFLFWSTLVYVNDADSGRLPATRHRQLSAEFSMADTNRTWSDVIVGNLRAERGRAGLDQKDVVERMRALGFTWWHRQTISRVERGDRKLAPDELLGLSLALEVPLDVLLFPAAGDNPLVQTPDESRVVTLPARGSPGPARARWQGNTPGGRAADVW